MPVLNRHFEKLPGVLKKNRIKSPFLTKNTPGNSKKLPGKLHASMIYNPANNHKIFLDIFQKP